MFARSVRGALLLIPWMLFAAADAEAKQWTFETGMPLGLGLQAGLTTNPESDLLETPTSTSSGFSHYFAFEPYLDFGSFAIRATMQLHNYPIWSGRGSDSGGSYSETSDPGSFLYGAHVLLAPYISESKKARAYIKLGIAQAIAQGENRRTYQSGTIYTEDFSGIANELSVGAGFEFFLVQNYSMVVEAGYRQLEFGKFEYEGGTDLNGTAKNKGDPLLKANGSNRTFNHNGAYFSAGFNLNF